MEFVSDTEYPVKIPCQQTALQGLLHIPSHATGVVIFVHGSGSSHLSPRNQQISHQLQQAQFATLLFDLLTPEEDQIDAVTRELRFDIPLLSTRLILATTWLMENPVLHKLPAGYFGASTGAAAALVGAAENKNSIKAVVSRGGRPDLAGAALHDVTAATLLLVGGNDAAVIELNQQAFAQLHCKKELQIIPGASHLFEEEGKLEEVGNLTKAWFQQYLK